MLLNTYRTPQLGIGLLNKEEQQIKIYNGCWYLIENGKETFFNPIHFIKQPGFNRLGKVYYLTIGGSTEPDARGVNICLSFWQNQKFLCLQKAHWFQKEENVRYIINILFLLGGITMGILNYLK